MRLFRLTPTSAATAILPEGTQVLSDTVPAEQEAPRTAALPAARSSLLAQLVHAATLGVMIGFGVVATSDFASAQGKGGGAPAGGAPRPGASPGGAKVGGSSGGSSGGAIKSPSGASYSPKSSGGVNKPAPEPTKPAPGKVSSSGGVYRGAQTYYQPRAERTVPVGGRSVVVHESPVRRYGTSNYYQPWGSPSGYDPNRFSNPWQVGLGFGISTNGDLAWGVGYGPLVIAPIVNLTTHHNAGDLRDDLNDLKTQMETLNGDLERFRNERPNAQGSLGNPDIRALTLRLHEVQQALDRGDKEGAGKIIYELEGAVHDYRADLANFFAAPENFEKAERALADLRNNPEHTQVLETIEQAESELALAKASHAAGNADYAEHLTTANAAIDACESKLSHLVEHIIYAVLGLAGAVALGWVALKGRKKLLEHTKQNKKTKALLRQVDQEQAKFEKVFSELHKIGAALKAGVASLDRASVQKLRAGLSDALERLVAAAAICGAGQAVVSDMRAHTQAAGSWGSKESGQRLTEQMLAGARLITFDPQRGIEQFLADERALPETAVAFSFAEMMARKDAPTPPKLNSMSLPRLQGNLERISGEAKAMVEALLERMPSPSA